MDEPLINPISTDKNLPVKDLLESDEQTVKAKKEKTKNKRSFFYYVGVGVVMIVLVVFGLMFGFYFRSQQFTPPPVTEPTPTVIEESKEATPATTLEVIKEKMGTLEGKLNNESLLEEELLPPELNFNLEDQLK